MVATYVTYSPYFTYVIFMRGDCGVIPVAFEAARVLATLVQPNHIVHLCSGTSLTFRLHTSSILLGILLLFQDINNVLII